MDISNDITVAGLLEAHNSFETIYASHYGSKMNKKLTMTHAGGYKVYNQGEVILETMSPQDAVEKYNSIKKS